MDALSATAPAEPAAGPPPWHPCPVDPACPYCNPAVPHAAEPCDWSFLDAAYCISLRTRDDRMASVVAQLHRVGLCRKVTFHRPERHPQKSIAGSWESHRAVARHALEQGCATALVLEDDVVFSRRVTARTVRAIGQAIAGLPPDWMIFFLGHWPLAARFVRRNVLRTSSGCAHAYVTSRRLMQWLVERPWGTPGVPRRRLVGDGVDAAFACLPGTYALFPMICTQSASPSDNSTPLQKARVKNNKRKRWRMRHIVTHSRYREVLLSRLMRPSEIVAVALSPLVTVADLARRAGTGLVRLGAVVGVWLGQ